MEKEMKNNEDQIWSYKTLLFYYKMLTEKQNGS